MCIALSPTKLTPLIILTNLTITTYTCYNEKENNLMQQTSHINC